MAEVKVYTWSNCPYCVRAKNLLNDRGIPFTEINLDGKDAELEALKTRTKFRTIPQIFIGELFVGGFQELAELDRSGQLKK